MAEIKNNLEQILINIARAIKEKKEDNTAIQAINFDTEILNIPIKLIPNSGTEKRIAGHDLYKGELVRLNDSGEVIPYSGNLYGIAKTSAKAGEKVEIYTPFVPKVKIDTDIILNTGESDNYGFKQVGKKYRSQNEGINSSYSKAKINVTSTKDISIVFYCSCYAENNYDYGVISKLDTLLSSSSNSDNSNSYSYNNIYTSDSTTYTQYSINIPGDGQKHFIEIKYRKDSSVSNNNDYLQFYYEIGEPVAE